MSDERDLLRSVLENVLDAETLAEAKEYAAEALGIDTSCPDCRGTGIGQHGDPDTSRCGRCRGKGEL